MGIDDVFAVIAEGTRRQILERLRAGDRAVGDLVLDLQVSQPTVSKHLKVLREAGLVTMRAEGQKRYYALRAEPLGEVRSWLGGFDAPVVDDMPAAAAPAATLDAAPDTGEPDPGTAAVAGTVVVSGAGTVVVSTTGTTPVPGAVATTLPGAGSPISRTMGRAAERAADLLSQLRRRRDTSS